MDIDVVIENLVELLTNSVNMTDKFYDIFFNPEPMDVELQQYNSDNKLVTVVIPNRAKDLRNILINLGSPESSIAAPQGTLCIDTSAPQLYIKVEGDDEFGWVPIPNQDETITIIENYLQANGYVTDVDVPPIIENYLEENNYAKKSDISNATISFVQGDSPKGSITLNQSGDTTITLDGGEGGSVVVEQIFSDSSTNPPSCVAIVDAGFIKDSAGIESALGYVPYSSANPDGYINSSNIPRASSSSFGTVKYDNNSISLNSDSQLKVDGVVERNSGSVETFWVGTEAQYNAISSKNASTIYIIKDTES